ncbi:MAG: M3 family metallopeptidase [Bacteroidales bacterium]|nr:M3 family metallopeptidase [Bacteroidales bacterium]
MKKTLLKFIILLTLTSCAMSDNPLLEIPREGYGQPPFDQITLKHYKPALLQAIAKAKKQVNDIINNPNEPTFENTVEALELAGEEVDWIANIFFNLNEAETSDKMQKLAQELSPLLTEYQLYIALNEELFLRVKEVHENTDSDNLTIEQARLLQEMYKGFIRSGAHLSQEDKKTYGKIQERLFVASIEFSRNVLAANKDFTLTITRSQDLKGLPPYLVEMGKEAALARKEQGWVFTLDSPSFTGFMKYCENRTLREKMWKAYSSRCIGKHNNRDLIREMVDLRIQTARILGYETFADYAIETRMAKDALTVQNFLQDLMQKTLPYARKEVAEVQQYARSKDFKGLLMPWDFAFWSEKYREESYHLNEELLKPYFSLENVQAAFFDLVKKLYGLDFRPEPTVPVYHPDVQVFRVLDEDGKFLALLYTDYYPRAGKRGGAWMTVYRRQHFRDNKELRPFVSLVTNITKPTLTTPALLTLDEITTLFHEFGHCLQGVLAEGRYGSLTGTAVARDFVELPSQIIEAWAFEPEFIRTYAIHYKTKEVIPEEYIERIVATRNFLAGYAQVRQLQFGMIDMAWHNITEVPEEDPVRNEEKTLERYQLLTYIPGTAFSPAFTHIFSGAYSAGYYSYKWAEVLGADAFEYFKEEGIYNREVADLFRKHILSRGNIEAPDVLYRKFRGHDPEPDALMRKLFPDQ